MERVALADLGWKEKDLELLISHNIQDCITANSHVTDFAVLACFRYVNGLHG